MTGEVACVGVVTVELRRKEMFEGRFNGDARANGRETRQRDIVVKMLARDRGSRNAQSQGCSPEKSLMDGGSPQKFSVRRRRQTVLGGRKLLGGPTRIR